MTTRVLAAVALAWALAFVATAPIAWPLAAHAIAPVVPSPLAGAGIARGGEGVASPTAVAPSRQASVTITTGAPPPASSTTSGDRDIGDVAVIETDATILQPGEPFDLNAKTLTFTPASPPSPFEGYTVTVGPGALDPDGVGSKLLGLADNDSRVQFFSGFSFPFYGTPRDRVFVNSDGNLTFESGDTSPHFNPPCAPDPLNLGRGCVLGFGDVSTVLEAFAGEPDYPMLPRIAVLWQDWDPSADGIGGVFVNSPADRLVVTWQNVQLFGGSARFTFQAVLFRDGRIKLSYADVPSTPGGGFLVGISPASGFAGWVTTLDFSESAAGAGSISDHPHLEALAQVFGTVAEPYVHVSAVTRRFYGTHDDRFDQGLIFSSFDQAMGNALAFELTVKQTVAGIGREAPELGSDYSTFGGSHGVGQSVVNMGWLGNYPFQPTDRVPLGGANTTLSLLGQESGHMWLASVKFDDGGVCNDDLLGRDLAHWSFFLDSDGSVMEGNEWFEAPGTFTSGTPVARYSALDQYLMGLRPEASVPSFFYIRNPSHVGCFVFDPDVGERSCPPSQFPVTVTGTRTTVGIGQVTGNPLCNGGARVPAAGFSEVNTTTTWRQAFILVVRPGVDVTANVQKLETIRSAWVQFFSDSTRDATGRPLGSVSTALRDPQLSVSGPTDLGTVAIGASADLTLTVQNTGGGTLIGTAAMSPDSSPFFSVTASDQSFSVAAGASQPVRVHFAPTAAGVFTGTVQFSSNGVNGGAASQPVTARAVQRFTLTVARMGTGSGTVTGDGIDCGATCSASLDADSVVTLTAAPATGSRFAGWSGAGVVCPGLDPCQVTMNEAKSVTATFVLLPPDLTVTVVSPATATVRPGARLGVTVTIRNNPGAGPAGASTTRLYLSSAPARGAGARLLGPSQRFPALASGAAETRAMTAVVPRAVAPGTYHVVACADDLRRLAESDEINNCLASTAVTVAGPDLVVDAVASLKSSVVAGDRFIVRATLRNASSVPAGVSVMRFYLAQEPSRGSGDRLLSGGRTFGLLTPTATATMTTSLGVPAATPAGTYFLLACADDLGRVAESDETNNCRASAATIMVTSVSPDTSRVAAAGAHRLYSVPAMPVAGRGPQLTVAYVG